MASPTGEVKGTYTASWLLRILMTLFGLFLVLPGVAMMGGRNSTGVGVVFLVLGAAMIGFFWWSQAGVLLTVRTDGIEWKSRWGHKWIPWSGMASYTFIPQQRQYYGGGLVGVAVAIAVEATTKASDILTKPMAVTFVGADGTKIRVSGLVAKHQVVGNELTQQATEAIFARVRAEFDAGRPVTFGKLVVSKQGLAWGGKTLAWNELERAQMIEKRVFTLRKIGKSWPWVRVALQRVPSAFAVVRLLNHARETQLPQLAPAAAATGAIESPR